MKMNFIERWKDRAVRFYSTAPKRNIWFFIAVFLFLYNYLFKITFFLLIWQIALLNPAMELSDFDKTIEAMSESAVERLVPSYEGIFEAGHIIAVEYPGVATIAGETVGYLYILAIYGMIFYCGANILKYIINRIYVYWRTRR